LEKSIESIDRESAAGKDKCSAERFLGRRLCRSNRECADFGNLGFFEVHDIWNIASMAKRQSLHPRQRRLKWGVSKYQFVSKRRSTAFYEQVLYDVGGYFINSFK
jgi:hypothetical protein